MDDLTTTPAAALREWLDYVLWETNGPTPPLTAWRALLLARPDAGSEDVQRAVAVIDEWLFPDGSSEAMAARRRAWPDDSSPGV